MAPNSTLLLLRRLCHQHRGLHFFPAAALSHTANRCRVQVIAADGETAVSTHCGALVRHVQTVPADFRAEPGIDPGVAGGVVAAARVQISADVTSGHADGASGGDEDVGVVLADAFA